jgi:hypothetical protein
MAPEPQKRFRGLLFCCVFLFCGGGGVFAGGFVISIGEKCGFLMVAGGVFMVRMRCLAPCFSGLKICHFLEVYFSGGSKEDKNSRKKWPSASPLLGGRKAWEQCIEFRYAERRRRMIPAAPRMPVPRRASELGSGTVGGGGSLKVVMSVPLQSIPDSPVFDPRPMSAAKK